MIDACTDIIFLVQSFAHVQTMSADQPPQKKESELLKNAMSIIAAKEAEAAEACNETWNEPMLNFVNAHTSRRHTR